MFAIRSSLSRIRSRIPSWSIQTFVSFDGHIRNGGVGTYRCFRSVMPSFRTGGAVSSGLPLGEFENVSTRNPLTGHAQIIVRNRSNRSRRGLYDGKDVRTGNRRSFSMKKTKRKFKPNVFLKRVYSEVLDEMVRFHLTTSALRSIDKAGGLDNYLLTSKHVTEGEGLVAKKRVLKKMKQLEANAARETKEAKEVDFEEL